MPAKTPDSPSVARLIVAVSRSLERYEATDLPGALACLEGFQARTLPERSEWLATELERDSAAALSGAPVVSPALDCIDLARDCIRQELGEPVRFAVMPVRLALNTALRCLGADRTHVSDLPASWGTLAVLASLDPDDIEAAIADGAIHPEMERKDAEGVT